MKSHPAITSIEAAQLILVDLGEELDSYGPHHAGQTLDKVDQITALLTQALTHLETDPRL